MSESEETVYSAVELAILADDLLRKLNGQAMRTDAEREAEIMEAYAHDAARRKRDEDAARAERARQREHYLHVYTTPLPPKVRSALLAGAPADDVEWPVVSAARLWLAGTCRVLLIRGGVGVGKTMAAGTIAMDVCSAAVEQTMRHGYTSCPLSWHRPNDFVSAMLHKYDKDAPRLGDTLVVVDDVGRETRTDFEEALCTFLDDSGLRLVMTTNLTKDQFRERYGMRVVDRLLECGAALTVKGESRRKRQGDF